MLRKILVRKFSYFRHQYSAKASINNKNNSWKSVIGLEVHAQIATNSKLFSGSKTVFGAPLNTCVSLFDASVPGTLPVLNKSCVEAGIKTALALNCRLNPVSMFDRKHYFYADLPAGYQITQQRAALANNGKLSFPVFVPGVTKKPYRKTVKLSQLQLEQDSGKSIHDDIEKRLRTFCNLLETEVVILSLIHRSLVDLNRAGAPLMELVFEPDLDNGEEAAALVKELILILKRLKTCNCRMEEGSLRVDANISINRFGEPLGTRTEIKNIGSVRNIAQAVTYEINRQIEIKNSGGVVMNETRSWDAEKKKTIAMRDKEVLQDYRFMPEPNLPPLHIDMSEVGDSHTNNSLILVSQIKSLLPELPEQTRQKLISNFKLPEETAIILVNEPTLLNFFEKITELNNSTPAKLITNFLINDFLALCHKNNVDVEKCHINVNSLIDLIKFIEKETINLASARTVLQELYYKPSENVENIIARNDLWQISDLNKIDEFIRDCLSKNSKTVQQYKKGKKKVLYALAGEIVKTSNQKANMGLVIKRLEELLKLDN